MLDRSVPRITIRHLHVRLRPLDLTKPGVTIKQEAQATAFATDVVNGLRNRGVLTGSIGPDANILKLRPPMVFSKENADFMFEILSETLASL